ncbi:MAG: hypothetical protein ACO29C_06710 [Fluviibacter sp.]
MTTPTTPTTTAAVDAKRVPVIMATIDGTVLKLTFSNGKTLELKTNAIADPAIREAAMMHGFKQKLVDAAAISRNTETGRAASVEDKYQAVLTVFNRLTDDNPQWNATREGGGNSGGLLLRALVRMYDGRKTEQELRAYLDAKTDAQKTALRGNPKVAAIIEELRAESGKAANIDSNELLGELED